MLPSGIEDFADPAWLNTLRAQGCSVLTQKSG
jgi:hypothetical protein